MKKIKKFLLAQLEKSQLFQWLDFLNSLSKTEKPAIKIKRHLSIKKTVKPDLVFANDHEWKLYIHIQAKNYSQIDYTTRLRSLDENEKLKQAHLKNFPSYHNQGFAIDIMSK